MFIILPVGMNYRTGRLPVVTFTIMGINTLVYLISLVFFICTQGDSETWIYRHLWLIPAQSYLWTYLTSMFVHAGIFHLLGNMIFLFLFGCCVEDMIGRARFLAYYLVGGLVAELAFIAMSPTHFASMIPMGGASGAITGCMGMYLLLRADADIEFKYWYFILFFGAIGSGEFEVPAWVAITLWFLKDLFWMVFGLYASEGGGGVAFGAHVGGFLAGLALIGIYKMVSKSSAEPVADLVVAPVHAMAAVRPTSTSETPAIYPYDGSNQSGPFTLSQIQAMLACGSIGKEALYWSDGMTEWENVTDLSGQPLE
jgi:membrane associated rhomboid family serine protease